jgi:protease I
MPPKDAPIPVPAMLLKSPRRWLGLFLLVILVSSLIPGCASAGQKQILLLLSEPSIEPELFLTGEATVMIDLLTNAGFKVVTASDSGQPITAGNLIIKPDMKTADVNVEDYVGVMVPCMGRPDDYEASAATLKIVKEAFSDGKWIAAQNSGVLVLDQAGIMQGKQFAMAQSMETLAASYNGIYKGEGVVQDGKIITGGICPYMEIYEGVRGTTVDLTQDFINALKS